MAPLNAYTVSQGLVASKAAERKEKASLLREVLKKRSEIEELDQKPKYWNEILKNVIQYIYIESESLRKSKASVSTQPNENKKLELASLFKFVINTANKRKCKLKGEIIMKHICHVLNEDFLRESFGLIYSSVLLKKVLSIRKYINDISVNMWLGLLSTYCDMFLLGKNNLSKSLVAKIIHALIQAISLLTQLPTDELIHFYCTFFKAQNNKNEKLEVVGYILLSANLVIQQSAVNNRHLMCLLGESAMQLLLHFWCQQNPLQQHILVFFNFQLQLHNPCGARTEEEGAFAADWDVWKSHLKKIYEITHNHLEEFNSRQILRDTVSLLDWDLARFSADLYHQMFYINSCSYSPENSESGVAAKKQRLESGLSELREKINSLGSNKKVIHWLQLMQCLLEKHPSDFPPGEARSLLQVLFQFQTDAKRHDVIELSLSCLQILTSVLTTEYTDIWLKVWNNCVKKVTLKQCPSSNLRLMSMLIQNRCVNIQEDIWKFFSPFYMTPTRDSVQFLAIYCNYHDLPEHYQSELLTECTGILSRMTNNSNHGLYFLRMALINWLLPSFEENDEDTCPVIPIKQSFEMTDCDIVSSLLVTFFLSPVVVDSFCCHLSQCKDNVSKPSLVESLYLKMNFKTDRSAPSVTQPSYNPQHSAKCCLFTVIAHFKKHIRRLVSHIKKLTTKDDCCIQKVSYISCLLSKCLAYVDNRAIRESIPELYSNLSNKLQITLTKLGDLIEGSPTQSVRSKYIGECLPLLLQSFSADHIDLDKRCHYFDLIRSLMPDSLLDNIIAVVQKQMFPVPMQCSSRSFLSLETGPSSTYSENSTFDDDIFDEDDSTNNKFKESAMIDVFSQVLSAEETLCCQAMKLLCLWHSYDKHHTSHSHQNKITEILKNVDITKSFHLQMFEIIVSTLCSTHQHLSDSTIEDLLLTLRTVLKEHWHDPAVFLKCVNFLSIIFPHLSNEELFSPTSNISENRRNALKLLMIVWSLQMERKYSTSVRLAIASCLQTLIKASLPIDPEAKWAVDPDEEDTHKPLWRLYCTFLADPCFQVRHFCASNITCLFRTKDKNGNNLYLSEKQQESSFNDVYRYSQESLTVLALTISARKLKYKTLQELMVFHLPFLLNKWLTDGFPIKKFPYQLLGCSSKVDFYRKCSSVCVPLIAVVRPQDRIQETLDHLLGENWLQSQLQNNLVILLVHILPYLAVQECTEVIEKKVRNKIAEAERNRQTFLQYFKNEDVEICLEKNISDFVVQLLLCLDKKPDGVISQNPNPPYYNRDTILITLQYLASNVFRGTTVPPKSTLVQYLSLRSDHIWNILLPLGVHMNGCTLLSEQYRLMCSYQLFVKLLLKDFDTGLGECRFYIFREVLCRLLHHIERLGPQIAGIECCNDEKYIEATIQLILEMLQQFDVVSSKSFSQEFSNFLPWIVKTLLPYYCGYSFSQTVLNLFESILFNNNYEDGILKLDPFPKSEVLQRFQERHELLKYKFGKFSLQQEIECFLKTDEDVTLYKVTRSVESLKFLHQQLKDHIQELRNLIVKENCEDIVCQLIQELACIIQNESGEVAEAASLCLGVIGPLDLSLWTSSSQHSRNVYQKQSQLENLPVYQNNPNQQKYFQILYLLNQYLVDSCMTTVQCAAGVITSMLSTKAGRQFRRDFLVKVPFLCKCLYPFLKSKSYGSTKNSKNINIDDEYLWNPSHNKHGEWMRHLTCSLIHSDALNDEMLQALEPICQVKVEFCELVLPYLVHDICLNQQEDLKAITEHINNFFAQYSSMSNSPSGDAKSTDKIIKICMNKQSVQKMLNVVQYLRQQPRTIANRPLKRIDSSLHTTWQNNFWLDLDYSHIAEAANFCSAHFSAILYSEIWWYAQMESQERNSFGDRTNRRSVDDFDTFASLTDTHVKVQGVLLKGYREIGDTDGPYGCCAGTLSDPASRIQFYEHENQWKKAIVSYDIAMAEPEPNIQLGMLKSLHKCGLTHILGTYLNKLDCSISPELQELQYEAAWRAAQWNLDVPARLNTTWDFHKSLYAAMTCLSRNQNEQALEAAHIARLSVMRTLRESSLESCNPLYLGLSRLSCIAQLTEILQIHNNNTSSNLEILVERLEIQQQIWRADFEFVEPVQYLVCVLLSICGTQPENEGLAKQYQNLIRAACQDGKYEIAERCLYFLDELKKKHTLKQSIIMQTDFERAKFLWKRNEQTAAKNLMKSLIQKLELDFTRQVCSETAQLYPSALNTYGNWLAETRSENPKFIMQSYFAAAVSKLQDAESLKSRVAVEAYASLANYAHQQYRYIRNYMDSKTFGVKKDLMKDAQRDAQELSNLNVEPRFVGILQQQSAIDEAEVSSATEDCNKFLRQAIINFIRCLHLCDHHQLHIFAFVSLWFENAQTPKLTELLKTCKITKVKTCKFLPLIYQLAARMDSHQTPFQILLTQILSQVAQDHPHHVLSIIMALANSHEDSQYNVRPHTDGEGLNNENRVKAAKQLLCELSKSKIDKCVKEMDSLCKAYIQLAYYDVTKYKTQITPLPLLDCLDITKQKRLQHVAVATAFIPVQPDGNYSDIPYIIDFEKTFKLAGGINLPKIIQCRGSDGKKYKQLVKGRDDLRQDAIMQQVFGLVNQLLHKDTEAHKKRLKIRTYKVIPLSQRSGLLEWCEGTQPLGEYLIPKHRIYRPNDWEAKECRKKLVLAKSLAEKRVVYTEICQHFQPVMRHFFFEKFLDPVEWYECRVAYIKSVATNSIVGYILGLGDRHVQNILIDCTKAELVHIDLGIAFEQGKVLPTPETVPFRLTRDIVDGMGVCGVEGIFRRCCEKTMLVMHTNQQSLITILQVLLYDPLYNWTLSPSKVNQLQQLKDSKIIPSKFKSNYDKKSDKDPDKPSVNPLAERVLLRLQQKLQGIEDGIQLSLGGQVNHLIQEARNPDNLCRLFPGWQPYI
ncbi:serine-protein kinase ATM-like [Argonauta hians]